MKLIIDIPDEVYEYWKEHKYEYVLSEAIANGKPITDDIISRDDLLEEIQDYIECNPNLSGIFETMKVIVKNAETIIEADKEKKNDDS